MKWIVSAIIGILAFMVPAQASAPTLVDEVWADQVKLGYTPCKPVVLDLDPQELIDHPDTVGLAYPRYGGHQCEIQIKTVPDDVREWIVWHEVCHLSTMLEIDKDTESKLIKDLYHEHPLFKQCLSYGPKETGGY
jgi:hypothetical protein